jgi:8-oxo-dGTP pyrophosphatase MutT (NUDIX family)
MTSASEKACGLCRRLFSRALHGYFLMSRGLTLGVRAIVQSHDGKFLLVRHTYTPGWHFPGGGVERAEAAKLALQNELRQETGLKLSGRPKLHGIFYNDTVSKRDHVLAYICQVDSSPLHKPRSFEIAEIGYFGLDELPADTDPGTARRIREIVDGTEPSEVW